MQMQAGERSRLLPHCGRRVMKRMRRCNSKADSISPETFTIKISLLSIYHVNIQSRVEEGAQHRRPNSDIRYRHPLLVHGAAHASAEDIVRCTKTVGQHTTHGVSMMLKSHQVIGEQKTGGRRRRHWCGPVGDH